MTTILQGCCYEKLKTIPEKSIHCCVTSPPYWGLRDYGSDVVSHFPECSLTLFHSFQQPIPAWSGQLGLEPTPEMFIAHMVLIFREVKRVLRDDGTLWLNIGDSYAGSGKGGNPEGSEWSGFVGNKNREASAKETSKPFKSQTIKPKDLVGIPWMLAFALRADGWYLRSDIIWHKPNPMPESVTDRPTKAHEYIFLLTKSKHYFYDAEAIKEQAAYDGRKDTMMKGSVKYKNGFAPEGTNKQSLVKGHERWKTNENGERVANKRTVWSITTQPYAGAHFATFPEELPTLCIKAGTSEKGCCPQCRSPRERILEKEKMVLKRSDRRNNMGMNYANGTTASGTMVSPPMSQTTGWEQTCKCPPQEPIPCTVLDPFGGSGTTADVATRMGRNAVLIELNPTYIEKNIKPRLHQAEGLFK